MSKQDTATWIEKDKKQLHPTYHPKSHANPLVIERGAYALNPRGELYTTANIQEILTMRNFMDELRGAGVETGGPAAFSLADRQSFANQLDRFLAKHMPA